MIYITGDTHGDDLKFKEDNMPGESSWTSKDTLIICGDFGFIYYDDAFPKGKEHFDNLLDMLERKKYNIVFVDGNHENFDLLYDTDKYPLVEKYGNTVRKIRNNIFHLQRGLIYTIEGKTFFSFGGAYSIDKARRVSLNPERSKDNPVHWWPQELPNDEEYERGIESLKTVGYKVDYIITHTAPNTVLEMLKYTLPPKERENFILDPHDMQLRSYLDMLWHNATFKRWYFGHWHYDKHLTDKARALLFDVETIY